jgi:hypothetical protein
MDPWNAAYSHQLELVANVIVVDLLAILGRAPFVAVAAERTLLAAWVPWG